MTFTVVVISCGGDSGGDCLVLPTLAVVRLLRARGVAWVVGDVSKLHHHLYNYQTKLISRIYIDSDAWWPAPSLTSDLDQSQNWNKMH